MPSRTWSYFLYHSFINYTYSTIILFETRGWILLYSWRKMIYYHVWPSLHHNVSKFCSRKLIIVWSVCMCKQKSHWTSIGIDYINFHLFLIQRPWNISATVNYKIYFAPSVTNSSINKDINYKCNAHRYVMNINNKIIINMFKRKIVNIHINWISFLLKWIVPYWK